MGYSVRRYIGFVILLFTIVIYSNSFHASWHLDDYHTVVFNKKIHMSHLTPESITQSMHSAYGNHSRLYRPIPCFTFALNWLWGKDDVVGYHLFNLLLHLLTAYSLFLLIQKLLETQCIKESNSDKKFYIAILAATLWAVNPMHTQTVTYIVQRMALFSTLFYVLSILYYVKARFESISRRKGLFFLLSSVMFLFAIMSKENAVTLPVAVILVEWIFFHKKGKPYYNSINRWVVGAGFAVMLILSGYFLEGKIDNILKGYDNRTFTMGQRLLTEPRVLIFYMTQFLYPIPNRFSIEHDVELSTSLFSPISTLPAIFIVFTMILLALVFVRKKPLICFAILFYFLNHVIESSIVGLEIIFEHRNYLPSAFLFLPVAWGLYDIIEVYRNKKRMMSQLLIAFTVLIIIGFGTGTFIRNRVWATEKTLWEDAISKAPNRGRPYHNLAWGYYEVRGEYEKALALYKTSLDKKWSSTTSSAFSLYGMGEVHLKKGDYLTAARLFDEAISVNRNDEVSYRQSAISWLSAGDFPKASDRIDVLLKHYPENPKYLYLKGLILLHEDSIENAMIYFRQMYAVDPLNTETDYMIGVSLYKLGKTNKAAWFLEKSRKKRPNDIAIYLLLAIISKEKGDTEKVDQYLDDLLGFAGIDAIIDELMGFKKDNKQPPVSLDLIVPDIESKMMVLAKKMEMVFLNSQ